MEVLLLLFIIIRREKGSLDVNSIGNREKKIIINMVTVITGVINK